MTTAEEVFARCQGCGESLILCDADWYTESRPCCGCCTHQRTTPEPNMVDG